MIITLARTTLHLSLGLFIGLFPLASMGESTEKIPPIHEYQLDNGLKVLVKQDKRAPIAALYLWYKVGSSYEQEGSTGLSHVLEHMMFKGTEKHPTGEFNRILAENGAQDNAFTSQDYTAYYEVIASDRLEVAMELEADRMRGVLLPPKEFKKELEVVKEERRWRTEDKPTSMTYEQFQAAAFMNSPYRTPVIGWMTDLNNMKVEDARTWYKKWYAPNNATLIVVGDVEPEAVHQLAQKYFASIAKSKIPQLKPQTEVTQIGLRSIQVKVPAKVPYFIMGYKTPNLLNAKQKWEPYALEVLASILDGGSSARLAKELVRKQEIASSIGASYNGYGRLSDLFTFSGVPAKGIEVAAVRKAIEVEINQLKTQLVSQKELDRVKAQTISSEVYERDSIQHQATVMGFLESVGLGYQLMDDYVKNIAAISAEQIQTVAKKYFVEDRLTFAELIPQAIDPNEAPKVAPQFSR
jgi:zinc protease